MVYEQSKRKWVLVQVVREPFFECHSIGWVYSQNYLIQSILASIDITRHSTGLTLVYDYLSLVDPSTSRCHYISISHLTAANQPLAAPASCRLPQLPARLRVYARGHDSGSRNI